MVVLKGAHFLIILQVIFGFNWLRFIVQYLVSNQPSYKEKKYIGTAETDFKHKFNNQKRHLTSNTFKTTRSYSKNNIQTKLSAFISHLRNYFALSIYI